MLPKLNLGKRESPKVPDGTRELHGSLNNNRFFSEKPSTSDHASDISGSPTSLSLLAQRSPLQKGGVGSTSHLSRHGTTTPPRLRHHPISIDVANPGLTSPVGSPGSSGRPSPAATPSRRPVPPELLASFEASLHLTEKLSPVVGRNRASPLPWAAGGAHKAGGDDDGASSPSGSVFSNSHLASPGSNGSEGADGMYGGSRFSRPSAPIPSSFPLSPVRPPSRFSVELPAVGRQRSVELPTLSSPLPSGGVAGAAVGALSAPLDAVPPGPAAAQQAASPAPPYAAASAAAAAAALLGAGGGQPRGRPVMRSKSSLGMAVAEEELQVASRSKSSLDMLRQTVLENENPSLYHDNHPRSLATPGSKAPAKSSKQDHPAAGKLWREARAAMMFLGGKRAASSSPVDAEVPRSTSNDGSMASSGDVDPLARLVAPQEKAVHLLQGRVEFPTHKVHASGVSFKYLLKFAEALPQVPTTTQQVVQQYILPRTALLKSRFTEVVPQQYVHQAKYFVSHAWSGDFHEMCRQLERYFTEGGIDSAGAYVWLDVMCANLHAGALSARDPQYLKDVITSCKQVLLVVDTRAASLMRSWCWYEVWVGVTMPARTKYEFVQDRLHILAYDADWCLLAGLLPTLKVEHTEASVAEDKQRLLQELATDPDLALGSLDDVSIAFKAGLVEGAHLETVAAEKVKGHNPRRYMSATYRHALMLAASGNYWAAEKVLRSLLLWHSEKSILKPGEHAALLVALGVLMTAEGYHEEAARLGKESLEYYEAQATYGDPSVAEARQHIGATALMANVRFVLKDYAGCEAACKEVLAARKQLASECPKDGPVEGIADRGYVTVLRRMAGIQSVNRNRERAEAFARNAVKEAVRLLGREHMDSVAAQCELASVLQAAGKPGEALEALQQALAVRSDILGPAHPLTLEARAQHVGLLMGMQQYEEVEPLVLEVHAASERHLGEAHAVTCSCIAYIGQLRDIFFDEGQSLRKEGDDKRAEAVLRRALDLNCLAWNETDEKFIVAELVEAMRKQGKVVDVKSLPTGAATNG